MWTEEIKDNKGNTIAYKFVKRYKDEKTGKTRRVSVRMEKNTPQARNKAESILNAKIKERTEKNGEEIKLTFGQAYQAYYDYKKTRWERSTEASTTSLYNNHIQPYDIDSYLVSKISSEDVRVIVDQVHYENKLSATTARKVRGLIKSVILYCKDEYGISTQVNFKRVPIPVEGKKLELDYIDSSILNKEIKRMHELIGGRYAEFFEVQILTGMRFSELAALTKNDWDRETIRIDKAVKTAEKRAVGKNKTYHSARIIQSSDRINEIFDRIIKENDMLFGEKSNLIFANQANKPQLNYYLNRKLKRVNSEYTTHTLRHTHISLLAENNMPLKYIMERVGHVKPSTTLMIYTHVTKKMEEKGQSVLNNLF